MKSVGIETPFIEPVNDMERVKGVHSPHMKTGLTARSHCDISERSTLFERGLLQKDAGYANERRKRAVALPWLLEYTDNQIRNLK